jgi:hypothetical protein
MELPLVTEKGQVQMKDLKSRLKFNLYLLKNLPAAWFMGCSVKEINFEKCVVELPYRWSSKNPFRSIYFAAQCAAAELSTGLPTAVALTGKPSTSMLLVGIETKFYKKADSTSLFICEDNLLAQTKINDAIRLGESQTFTMVSKGYNAKKELISESSVTWSVKMRKAKK